MKEFRYKVIPLRRGISKGYIPKGYCLKGFFLTSHSFNHRVYDDRCTKLSDKHPKSQGPLLDSTKRKKKELEDELFWVGDRRFADFYRGHYRSFWQWSLRLDLLETAGSPHFSQPPSHLGYLWHGKRLITAFWPLQKKGEKILKFSSLSAQHTFITFLWTILTSDSLFTY